MHPISAPYSLGTARYYQELASQYTNSDDIDSISHAHTTVDSYQERMNETKDGSIYSYNSTRDVGLFVREIHGRIFNALSDTYLLPTDDAEWIRLDKQHSLLLIAFNGLTPCPSIVDAVLTPSEDETRRILDIGCGTGIWAIEMALRYPHVFVKGVDLAPPPHDTATFPPNLQIEIDDVNKGLSQFYGMFDLVHARFVTTGFTNAQKTIRELQLCLKPGGLLLIMSRDKDLYDEEKNNMRMAKFEGDEEVDAISTNGSWLGRKIWEAHEASKLAGSDHERASEIIHTGFWDHPLCDPETASSGSLYVPVGPWVPSTGSAENSGSEYLSILMRQVLYSFHHATDAMILRHRISEETLDSWNTRVDEELSSLRLNMWARYTFSWARRRAGKGRPAPPLPSISPDETNTNTSNTSSIDIYPRYSVVEIFHTREEARSAWQKKRQQAGVLPTSAVKRASLAIQF